MHRGSLLHPAVQSLWLRLHRLWLFEEHHIFCEVDRADGKGEFVVSGKTLDELDISMREHIELEEMFIEKHKEELKNHLLDVGIDPDTPSNSTIVTSSPHNKILCTCHTHDEMENIALQVKNDVLGETMTLLADTEKGVAALTEEVFRLWARQEAEPDYICTLQNYARRPPKRHSTVQFVGIQYRGDEAYMRYKRLKDGEKVLLLHEHSNPYDENAVKVLSQDGYHIGYLAREYARKVGKMFTYVGYGWHYHYDEEHDFFNAIHLYKNYMEYEEERDTFDYSQ